MGQLGTRPTAKSRSGFEPVFLSLQSGLLSGLSAMKLAVQGSESRRNTHASPREFWSGGQRDCVWARSLGLFIRLFIPTYWLQQCCCEAREKGHVSFPDRADRTRINTGDSAD